MATFLVSIRQSRKNNVFKRAQRWYWVLVNTDNNKVMARSSENYTNRQDCVDAATLVNGGSANVFLRATNGVVSYQIRWPSEPPSAT